MEEKQVLGGENLSQVENTITINLQFITEILQTRFTEMIRNKAALYRCQSGSIAAVDVKHLTQIDFSSTCAPDSSPIHLEECLLCYGCGTTDCSEQS